MADIPILSEYLAEASRRKFAFGELDCCTFMADWLMRCGLPDAMADRRGAYATREEYERAMRNEGGIERSCSNRFDAIGLSETDAPTVGDVCLVKVPALGRRTEMTGAICATEQLRALVTVDMGVIFVRLPMIRAWSGRRG